ncbi:uncharacterized protein LOC107272305 [Cephus cinctus]|uniref:Uncharacterized protein LOC107272305 n=1 Tax=Cephus cinctus TaxID=211228 RepID=A0AAJ7FRM8_CEPCN|nr:uncharacterized protein LOC107272305 [Cephus cinctus]
MSALLVRACLAAALARTILGALPPYIKPCKRTDPDIDICVANSIESLRGKLAEGIPELGAPPIEPLYLDQVRLLRGPSGARLDVNLTDIKVAGPSTFKVRDLKVNVDDILFTFKVSFDRLSFRGKYQIDARVLLLRLSGNGDLTGNFTGYDSDVILTAKKVYRNNGEYLDFERMKLAIKIGTASVYLNNLFGGDPILGAASNQVLNANSALFVEELRPVLESSLADLFTDVANKITRSFTYDELFPVLMNTFFFEQLLSTMTAMKLVPVLVLFLVSRSRSTSDIPSFLKICHRNDPNLNECIKHSVESLKPHLKVGIPSLHIPPCEPLHVPQVEIKQAAGPVSISSTYTNIRVRGATDFVLKSVKIDLDKDRVRLKLYVPRLEMTSNYTMEGKILMLPITGKGLAYGNYTDIDAVVTTQNEHYQDRKTGKTHSRVTDFYVDFDVGHASVQLENLFNGDETLADAMNLFLNDNWKTVAAEIKPALEDTVAELFKNFSNKIYSKYPLETLLPE